MDVFAHVCVALAGDDLRRLRAFEKRSAHSAKFSSWLVVVVRNLTIDWVRKEQGRTRVRTPGGLTDAEREIFQRVFVRGDSHLEAYEQMRSGSHPEMSFSQFLQALRRVYRARGSRATRPVRRENVAPEPLTDQAPRIDQVLEQAELTAALDEALKLLATDERLAVQLFVVEEVCAAEVARLVGWPNAKAVYNRVYRALAVIRKRLEQDSCHSVP